MPDTEVHEAWACALAHRDDFSGGVFEDRAENLGQISFLHNSLLFGEVCQLCENTEGRCWCLCKLSLDKVCERIIFRGDLGRWLLSSLLLGCKFLSSWFVWQLLFISIIFVFLSLLEIMNRIELSEGFGGFAFFGCWLGCWRVPEACILQIHLILCVHFYVCVRA